MIINKENSKYYSKWTGKQVDDAVGKASQSVEKGAISQTLGDDPLKVISQAAVTKELKTKPTFKQVETQISNHNVNEESHPFLIDKIEKKPNALNSRSNSLNDTYSANFINKSFAPLTFVSNLYASVIDEKHADLTTNKPIPNESNVLISLNSSNLEYDWDNPDFVFTRDLEVATTLSKVNSFTLNIFFNVNRNSFISWGAKVKISKDNGLTWTYISSNQQVGSAYYVVGDINNEDLVIFTDLLETEETFPIGTLLSIELFKKQKQETLLSINIYCGLTIKDSDIFTYINFNFNNININSNQIEDNAITTNKIKEESVTKAKLSKDLQEVITKVETTQNIQQVYSLDNLVKEIGTIVQYVGKDSTLTEHPKNGYFYKYTGDVSLGINGWVYSRTCKNLDNQTIKPLNPNDNNSSLGVYAIRNDKSDKIIQGSDILKGLMVYKFF